MGETKKLLFTKDLFLKCSLECLPSTISIGQEEFIADNLQPSDVNEAYALVKQAGEGGLNISVDEIDSIEEFRFFLQPSAAIAIRDCTSSAMKILLVINPSTYVRSFVVRNPALFVFLSPALVRTDILRELLKLSQQLVLDIGKGYTGCLFPVSVSCEKFISALSQEHFHSVAVIPEGSKLVGTTEEQFLYYKYLGGIPTKMPSLPEMTRIIEEVFCDDDDLEEIQIKSVPYLPLDYITGRNNLVRLRNMTVDDVPKIYQIFNTVASMGKGYGLDEVLSERIYRKMRLNGKYSIVFEDPKSSQIIGCVILESSYWVRYTNHGFLDASGVISPEYANKGIGGEMMAASLSIGKDLGFSRFLTDTIVGNLPAMVNFRKIGLAPVGILPNAVTSVGSTDESKDVVLVYRDFNNIPSFIGELYKSPVMAKSEGHRPKL